jgi:hypothetical protein
MNERIRELATDCAGQVEWDFPKNPESFTFNRTELEKFAELIVKECADFVAAGEFGDPGTAKQLMECFGVEEKTK